MIIEDLGANCGIGLGIAECCLMNVADKVYSIDLIEPGAELKELATRVPKYFHAVTADVTKEDSISAAVDQIVQEAGFLHGMVCNAGRTKHEAALDFTTEESSNFSL